MSAPEVLTLAGAWAQCKCGSAHRKCHLLSPAHGVTGPSVFDIYEDSTPSRSTAVSGSCVLDPLSTALLSSTCRPRPPQNFKSVYARPNQKIPGTKLLLKAGHFPVVVTAGMPPKEAYAIRGFFEPKIIELLEALGVCGNYENDPGTSQGSVPDCEWIMGTLYLTYSYVGAA